MLFARCRPSCFVCNLPLFMYVRLFSIVIFPVSIWILNHTQNRIASICGIDKYAEYVRCNCVSKTWIPGDRFHVKMQSYRYTSSHYKIRLCNGNPYTYPEKRSSWGQHGAHLGPTGPRWAQCWSHELGYLGDFKPGRGPKPWNNDDIWLPMAPFSVEVYLKSLYGAVINPTPRVFWRNQ